MGCDQSKELTVPPPVISQQEATRTQEIDQDLENERKEEEEKVKLLLLGTGESGKSTIFKQMRILYGDSKSDDDLRMYGVIVRSNIVVAIRKLTKLLQDLDLESQLDGESDAAAAADREDVSGMTARHAFDQILSYLVDNTAEPLPEPVRDESDWVGHSTRAGKTANEDAKQFLQHVEAIRVLWQVRKWIYFHSFDYSYEMINVASHCHYYYYYFMSKYNFVSTIKICI